MDVARKIAGIFILVSFAGPALSGMIWGAGLTTAVVSEEFLADMPKEVVRQAPELADELFAAAKQPEAITDPDAGIWMDAAVAAEFKPSEMLEASGIKDWLETEVSSTIDDVGKVLRGDMAPADVMLDNRPLKVALSGEVLRETITKVVEGLPKCDKQGFEDWRHAILSNKHDVNLPPCNPGGSVTGGSIDLVLSRTAHMPDQVSVFKEGDIPWGVNIPGMLDRFIWILFVVPVLLVLAGAAVADSSLKGILRWSGGTALVSGAIPLLTSSIAQAAVLTFLEVDPRWWDFGQKTRFWSSEASQILARRITGLVELVVENLFSPVTSIAAVVCVVGLFAIGLSFLATGND